MREGVYSVGGGGQRVVGHWAALTVSPQTAGNHFSGNEKPPNCNLTLDFVLVRKKLSPS